MPPNRDDAGRFAGQNDKLRAMLISEIETAAKTLVLQLDKNLRKATPVLTGHARASWVPSVGTPASDVPDAASTALHDAGVASVLAYKAAMGPLYESTNIAYMQRLNLGSSSQAPVGFIEVAIAQAQDTVNAKYTGRIVIDVASGIAGGGAENLASAYSPFGDA